MWKTIDYPAPPTQVDLDAYALSYDAYLIARITDPLATPPAPPVGGRETEIFYDADNDWVTGAANPENELMSYTHDDQGNVLTTTDGRGFVTRTVYDDIYRVIEIEHPDTDGDGVGAKQTWEYDPDDVAASLPPTDAVTKFTNEEGESTTTEFDIRRRPVRVSNHLGEIEETDYNYRTQIARRDFPDGSTPRVTTFTYDDDDRLTRVDEPDGKVMTYTYDKAGRMRFATDYPDGVAGLGRIIETKYDMLDRPIERVHPDGTPSGSSEFMTYDQVGRLLTMTDRDGKVMTYTYDDLGQKLTETNGNLDTTSYAYDGAGQLESITDANGAVTKYDYDLAGRQTAVTYAFGTANASTESYEYDDAGNQVKITHRDALVTDFVFDERNRMVSSTADEPDLANRTTDSFEYDDVSRMTKASSGRYNSDAFFSFDDAGRLASETEIHNSYLPVALPIHLTSYEYDEAGQLIKLKYPGNEEVRYTYTDRGEMDRVEFRFDSQDPWDLITDHEYDKAGQLTDQTFGDGSTGQFGYDESGRIDAVLHRTGYNIYDSEYERTSAGDIIKRDDLTPEDRDETFAYDDAHRLTEWNRSIAGQSAVDKVWSLDPVGNWEFIFDEPTTDPPANPPPTPIETRTHNELNEIATRSGDGLLDIEHDARGRVIEDGDGRLFTWDGRDRLTSVMTPGPGGAMILIESYRYDALGRRIERNRPESSNPALPTGVTLFAYAGNRAIEDRAFNFEGEPDPNDPRWLDPDVEPDVRGVYTFGAYLDEPLHMERWTLAVPDSTRFFYHRDHNYNVVAMTTEILFVTQVVERVEYTPYGEPTTYVNALFQGDYGNPLPYSRIGNPHLFTGQRHDPVTGLYYYKARYHSPQLGRFLSLDPLGYVDGVNLYLYGASNPAIYVDPEGTRIKQIIKLVPNTIKTIKITRGIIKLNKSTKKLEKKRRKTMHALCTTIHTAYKAACGVGYKKAPCGGALDKACAARKACVEGRKKYLSLKCDRYWGRKYGAKGKKVPERVWKDREKRHRRELENQEKALKNCQARQKKCKEDCDDK